MRKVAILDDYQNVATTLADWSRLGPDTEVTVFTENLGTEDEAARALEPFDVICLMRERMAVPASLIDRLPNLELINVTGARVRVIDFDHAVQKGITVCHTYAGESRHATPELAWGLIISLARSIPDEHQRVRDGLWQQTIGDTLGGRVLGIVGLGKLGGRMAAIAKAFEMEVVAWSPNLTDERAAEHGAHRVDKDGLFAQSDVVTLHMPLSERSRHTVTAREIALMKPGAMLINTSRGPLIEETALIAALTENRIRAGLDVFDIEPLPGDHPLRGTPNCVLTPHLGYVTRGSYERFYPDCVENILAWRDGAPVRVLAAPQ